MAGLISKSLPRIVGTNFKILYLISLTIILKFPHSHGKRSVYGRFCGSLV